MPLLPLAYSKYTPSTGSSPAQRLAISGSQEQELAPLMFLVEGPPSLRHCLGVYCLVKDMEANGYPVWMNIPKVMYLYSDPDEGWSIACTRAVFPSGGGQITSLYRHRGQMPHCINTWCYGDGTAWHPEPSIKVHLYSDTPYTPVRANDTLPSGKLRHKVSKAIDAKRACVRVAEGAKSPVSQGERQHSAADDRKTFLLPKEREKLKEAYDMHAHMFVRPDDMVSLHAALHAIGVQVDVDLAELHKLLSQARAALNPDSEGKEEEGAADDEAPPTAQPLPFNCVVVLCDLLKAHRQATTPQDDQEIIEAFVTLGGNKDRSGKVLVKDVVGEGDELRATLDGSREASTRMVSFEELKSMLQSDGMEEAVDAFSLAGGDPSSPESTVSVQEIIAALNMLSLSGSLEANEQQVSQAVSDYSADTQLTFGDFYRNVWATLGLCARPPSPSESDSDKDPKRTLQRNPDKVDKSPSIVRALSKHPRHCSTGNLQSAMLQRRFEQLCKRTDPRNQRGNESLPRCSLDGIGMQHLLLLTPHLLQHFTESELLLIPTPRSPSKRSRAARIQAWKVKVVRAVAAAHNLLQEHSTNCPSCQSYHLSIRTPSKPSSPRPPNLASAAMALMAFQPKEVDKALTVAPAKPEATKQLQRPTPGKYKFEPYRGVSEKPPSRFHDFETVGAVYIDGRGCPVPPPPPEPDSTEMTDSMVLNVIHHRQRPLVPAPPPLEGSPKKAQAAFRRHVASAKRSFVNRIPAATGQLHSRPVSRPAVSSPRGQPPSPPSTPPLDAPQSLVAAREKGIVTVPAGDNPVEDSKYRHITVRVVKKTEEQAAGLAFEKQSGRLVLVDVLPGSPAGKAGVSRLAGWELRAVNGAIVKNAADADNLLSSSVDLSLAFVRKRAAVKPKAAEGNDARLDDAMQALYNGQRVPTTTLLKLIKRHGVRAEGKARLRSKKQRTRAKTALLM